MAAPLVPTPKQEEIRDALGLGLLVVAPAGCGKTEALALRVRGLTERQQVVQPRRVLVLTFTNRARENIRERLRTHVRPEHMRSLVTVANFHGFAARLIHAHGNVIGIPPDIGIPESDWVTRVCRDEYGLDYNAVGVVNTLLRTAKQEARTDDEILSHLRTAGSHHAITLETRRQAEGRLTYDDLLRLAELILANDQVTALYRNLFAAVVVDEFQDLTPQQLRVVQRVGAGRTTFAGDLAQGIYGFAGAEPERVLRAIRSEVTEEVTFAESHRSSPAVLDLVNAIAPLVSGQLLTCARPDAWPSGGVAACGSFPGVVEEADWVLRLCKTILTHAPRHRIAVVARTKGRRERLDKAFDADDTLPKYHWDQPFVDKQTVDLVRTTLRLADDQAAARAPSRREYLWAMAGGQNVQDPSSREALNEAITWAADLHADGASFRDIGTRLRAVDGDTVLSAPGVHLLNGHLGKGQQFDWVVAVGLEQGTLPFFKATEPDEVLEEARVLAVIMSRARHGLVLSRVDTLAGWSKRPSQFLATVQAAPACRDLRGLIDWMKAVDWNVLAASTDRAG
jgi:DNA helicase-2/ATP-dependent DNA helicase PcrA